jgi:two-component system response regulator HydG
LYRINTVEIKLPPLREREDDIILLVNHFLSVYSKKYNKPGIRLSKSGKASLEQYNWPGNVRELQHAVERAVILCETNLLQSADFHFLVAQQGVAGAKSDNIKLDDLEKTAIKKALVKHGGNISQAAKELGLTRAALYRRIEKHGL